MITIKLEVQNIKGFTYKALIAKDSNGSKELLVQSNINNMNELKSIFVVNHKGSPICITSDISEALLQYNSY